MRASRATRRARIAAALWLAVVTVFAGSAHRPLAGFASAADLVDASGVVRSGVCGVPVDADHRAAELNLDRAKATRAICDACLLASSMGLAPDVEPILPVFAPLAHPRIGDEAPGRETMRSATARGPPRLA